MARVALLSVGAFWGCTPEPLPTPHERSVAGARERGRKLADANGLRQAAFGHLARRRDPLPGRVPTWVCVPLRQEDDAAAARLGVLTARDVDALAKTGLPVAERDSTGCIADSDRAVTVLVGPTVPERWWANPVECELPFFLRYRTPHAPGPNGRKGQLAPAYDVEEECVVLVAVHGESGWSIVREEPGSKSSQRPWPYQLTCRQPDDEALP